MRTLLKCAAYRGGIYKYFNVYGKLFMEVQCEYKREQKLYEKASHVFIEHRKKRIKEFNRMLSPKNLYCEDF